MARRPRLFAPGLLYHVIARGNQRQPTFLDAADYDAYLHRLGLYQARYGVSLYAYCLMPNHVHLLVRTADTPLAKFMQGLQESYTLRFNRIYEKVGHLFQGRYRAIVCDSEQYLLTLVRYIHLNPVRAGLSACPAEYPYSGHRTYLAGTATALLDPRPVLDLLGGPSAYARFVLDGLGDRHQPDLYPAERQAVLGGPVFAAAVAEQAGHPVASPHRPLEEIVGPLAGTLGLDLADVCGPDRSRRLGRERALLAFVLIRRFGYRRTDVAAMLGRDPATLSKALTRLAARAAQDERLANQLDDFGNCPKVKV